MYRCQNCREVTKPGEVLNKVVISKRPVIYRIFYKDKVTFHRESHGYETIKEENWCAECKETSTIPSENLFTKNPVIKTHYIDPPPIKESYEKEDEDCEKDV